MTKIKICGIRRSEDIDIISRYKPDFIGFILSEGFRRTVDCNEVREMTQGLPPDILKIGVFVNEPIESLKIKSETAGIDIVQLHGEESPDYCKKIAKPVIKVLTPPSFDRIAEYEPVVEYFLFDSGKGTGRTFDWNTLPVTEKPFFLAGGISADNVSDAIESLHPNAVDMSSSVETDGVKDEQKIKEIIELIRSRK